MPTILPSTSAATTERPVAKPAIECRIRSGVITSSTPPGRPADRHKPLTTAQIAALRPNPRAPQSERAMASASRGISPLEILGHGVLDPNPGVVGTPEQAADMLVEWMEAGVADGFTLSIDDMHDGIDAFADQVVPILRRRGWRPDAYEGTTLRDHMGVAEQLGLDPRLAQDD